MTVETSYKVKFKRLTPWMPEIIDVVKKDLKNEHLKNDGQFIKKYLTGKNVNKLTQEDLVEAYSRAIQEDEKGEHLGEFVTTRWLIKNSEIYSFYEEKLRVINPNFNEIVEIDKNAAKQIMDQSVQEFGALKSYVFSVLNSVAFPEEIFQQLEDKSKKAKTEKAAEKQVAEERASVENLQLSHAREIARLTDKYEKKIEGLQKKYLQDTDGLKKQLAQLQRQFSKAS